MKTSNKIGIIAVAIYLIVPLLIVGSSWLKVKNLPYDIHSSPNPDLQLSPGGDGHP